MRPAALVLLPAAVAACDRGVRFGFAMSTGGGARRATLMTVIAHTQDKDIEHHGTYWTQRLPAALTFLLGAGR